MAVAAARARRLNLSRSTKPRGQAVQGLAPPSRRPRCKDRSIQSGHGSARIRKLQILFLSRELQVSKLVLVVRVELKMPPAQVFQKGNQMTFAIPSPTCALKVYLLRKIAWEV